MRRRKRKHHSYLTQLRIGFDRLPLWQKVSILILFSAIAIPLFYWLFLALVKEPNKLNTLPGPNHNALRPRSQPLVTETSLISPTPVVIPLDGIKVSSSKESQTNKTLTTSKFFNQTTQHSPQHHFKAETKSYIEGALKEKLKFPLKLTKKKQLFLGNATSEHLMELYEQSEYFKDMLEVVFSDQRFKINFYSNDGFLTNVIETGEAAANYEPATGVMNINTDELRFEIRAARAQLTHELHHAAVVAMRMREPEFKDIKVAWPFPLFDLDDHSLLRINYKESVRMNELCNNQFAILLIKLKQIIEGVENKADPDIRNLVSALGAYKPELIYGRINLRENGFTDAMIKKLEMRNKKSEYINDSNYIISVQAPSTIDGEIFAYKIYLHYAEKTGGKHKVFFYFSNENANIPEALYNHLLFSFTRMINYQMGITEKLVARHKRAANKMSLGMKLGMENTIAMEKFAVIHELPEVIQDLFFNEVKAYLHAQMRDHLRHNLPLHTFTT